MSALLIGILVAFVGLAVDLGYWVSARSELQTAADLAALAGAQDLSAESSLACARLNGIETNEANITVQGPRVEVEIRRDVPAFFSRVVGHNHTRLVVRAAALQAAGEVLLAE